MDLENLNKQVDRLKFKYDSLLTGIVREESEIERIKQQFKIESKVSVLFQTAAKELQEKAHERISVIVTKCLQIVYQNDIEFTIQFERKRNKTEASLLFKKGEHVIDPMNASGGGLIDIASFALRLACLMLQRPVVRKTIVMDEPFRFVSTEYQDNIKTMMHYLQEKLNLQFIYVTHNEQLIMPHNISI